MWKVTRCLRANAVSLRFLKSSLLSHRNCIFLSDSFLMARFISILYSWLIIRMWVCLDSLVAVDNEIVAGLISNIWISKKEEKRKRRRAREEGTSYCPLFFSRKLTLVATMSMPLLPHIILNIILHWPIARLASHLDRQKIFFCEYLSVADDTQFSVSYTGVATIYGRCHHYTALPALSCSVFQKLYLITTWVWKCSAARSRVVQRWVQDLTKIAN